jgi:hypothetical protein
MRVRIWSLAGLLTLAAVPSGLGACRSSEDPVAGSNVDLTSINKTAARQQSINNCWLYATAAWTESLHLRVSKEKLDVSEAYWSYFYWFDQLTDHRFSPNRSRKIEATGTWGSAAEILRQRGWMNETDFLPQDGGAVYPARQKTAYEAFGAWAAGDAGTLDRASIIAALNRAWDLSPEVAQKLQAAFGATYERTLLSPDVKLEVGGVHAPREIVIGSGDGDPVPSITIEDLIGDPAPEYGASEGQRVGPYAWSQVLADGDFATGGHALLIRAQRALNQNLPLFIGWWAEEDALIAASGRYEIHAGQKLGATAYGHASLIVDDQVDAPGFGVLPVGVPETRPDALAATLLPQANIQFFRIKNSWWGWDVLDGGTAPLADGPGYNDIAVDYLRSPAPLGGTALMLLTLPNDPAMDIGTDVK